MKSFLSYMAALLFIGFFQSATATVVTFDDTTLLVGGDGTQIQSAGPLTISHNLYPEHPDGWYNSGNTLRSWYGEHNEYFQFSGPVHLDSYDVKNTTSSVTSIIIRYLDINLNTLGSDVFTTALSTYRTVSPSLDSVFRVEFDFTGGDNTYADGRTHAWFNVDNVSFTASSVPESSAIALMGLGLLGFVASRRRLNR